MARRGRSSKRLLESPSAANEDRRKRATKRTAAGRAPSGTNAPTTDAAEGKVSLDDLPDELLLQIVEHFHPDPDMHAPLTEPQLFFWEDRMRLFRRRCDDLRSLCLTSRRACRIARPMLYQVCLYLNKTRPRKNFLRTVAGRPDLGALVKQVDIGFTPELRLGVAAVEHPPVLEAARNVDIQLKRSFMTALRKNQPEAEIALALSQLPNLEYLRVCLDEEWLEEYTWLFRLVRECADRASTAGPTGPFSRLKRLRTSYGGMDYGYNPVFIADLLRLPSLTAIEVDSCWSGETCCGVSWNPRDGTSNVETIELDEAAVSNEFVRKLLRACKSPKTFVYKWGGPPPTDSMYNFADFMSALKTGKDTLEKIEFNTICKENYFESLALESIKLPPIGSFKAFSRLKELEISGHLLFGSPLLDWDHFDGVNWPAFLEEPDYRALADVFPASLERLVLDCMGLDEDIKFMFPFLDEFAARCSERLPNLRHVRLIVVDEKDFPLLERTKRDLEGCGIEVELEGFMEEDDDWEERYGEDGRNKICSRLIGEVLSLWPVPAENSTESTVQL